MSRTLRIVERARSDVDDIFNWLVHRSVQGAISWYLAFRQAIEKVASAPEKFAEAAGPASAAQG
jgi:plasmid stabilization system protein ParE